MNDRLVRAEREPQGDSSRSALLVLLHGLGSNEQDLIGLAPELDPTLRVVSLRAPHAYGMGGYAWFPIGWTANGIVVDEAEVHRSLDLLAQEVDHLRAEFGVAKLLLGGFSQGAMMTLGLALRHPENLAGALLLSGRGASGFFDRPSESIRKVPFLVQHGAYDEVLPVEGAREVRDALVGLGAPVEYHEYPMGHEVSWASLRDADRWIRERL